MTLLLMTLALFSLVGFSESQREDRRACPPPTVVAAPAQPSDDACFESPRPCALKEAAR